MSTVHIPFKGLHYFSSLIQDYLDQKSTLTSLYHRFPTLENFELQRQEKQQSFSEHHRSVLVETLEQQHSNGNSTAATLAHIASLRKPTTFTITTGHQLNLFTGPIYFLYKIVSTIQLTMQLKEHYPNYDFVPMYWMATEDHDFEEINYFNSHGKKIQWDRASGGAVGRFDTKGLDELAKVFKAELGLGKNAAQLSSLFHDAYVKHPNLTAATRYLVNELFGAYGIVAIDGDDTQLKQLFVPVMKQELVTQVAVQKVEEQANTLGKLGYKVQVNPREINLFYLAEGIRERIIVDKSGYSVNETSITWTQTELVQELEEAPQRFSPNVIMRPAYQEVILPNLCYIGGGGELAYWLELKSYFEAIDVPFPILLLRNSVVIENEKQEQKRKALSVTVKDLFLKQEDLIRYKVKQLSKIEMDFTPQRNQLQEQFQGLYDIAKQTDKSFENAVKAQEIKQLKGLAVLEKRLLKAQKRKLNDHVTRLTVLQDELFPNQSLQERSVNFSDFYLQYGEELIPKLMECLDPLSATFTVLKL